MQTIYLDVSNKGVIQTVYAKQGEVGRKFTIFLTDSGVPYVPSESTLFSAWYDGSSGQGNYTMIGDRSAFHVDENKVVVELITQMLENHGEGVLSISMNNEDGTEISTWNIPYLVEKKPGYDSPEAESYYTAFSEIVSDAINAANRAESAAENFVLDPSLSKENQPAEAAATGAALMLKSPAADVIKFGATGEGVEDDTEAIQSAFDSGLTVVFPAGKYKFSGINCNHSVDVIFENAEVVPDFYEGTNGVMRKLFTFTDCEKVTVKGLQIIAEPTANERAHNHLSESIAEFHNCENVQLEDWTVKNLMYWNRGNTPDELYDRKGVLFTAIDSKIEVTNCDFGNIAYEEWCWITYKDNLQGSAAHFKNCYFHDSSLGLSCVGILAHTAEVANCIFENITYDGSLANLLSLYGNFSDNLILNCDIESVCDFREGVWVFSTYAKIHNNRMVNSTAYKFAAVSGKDVHITNNIVTAKVFNYSHNPLEKNILREEGEVTKIRYVIENNVAEALDTEAVNADDSFLFFRFSNFVEGLWASSDSEILCRNNRFFSNKKGIKNANICAVDVGRIILHDNVLYLGNRSASSESGYCALQMAKVNVDEPVIDFVGNKIEMNTVNETATNPAAVQMASNYTIIKMNAFFNSARNTGILPLMTFGAASGALQMDGQMNINFTDQTAATGAV